MIKFIDKWLVKTSFKLLNIKLQPNQWPIALSCFLSLMVNSYIGPVLCKTAISELPPQWLSFETVWCCFSGLFIGMIWKGKFREKALKWFAALAGLESLAGLSLGMWLAFVKWNVWVYSVFSLFYVSVVSLTISRCIMAFKSKLWNEKSRELYDNTDSIVRNVGLLLGGILAIAFCPSLKIALMLFSISCLIDDIGWIATWFKLKEVLKE